MPLSDTHNRLVLSREQLVLLASAYFLIFLNFRFAWNVFQTYSLTLHNSIVAAAILILSFCLTALLLSFTCTRRTIKSFLAVLLPLSAVAAYFMDTYNVIISDDMLRNAVMTDMRELGDLFGATLVSYICLLGLAPAILLRWVRLVPATSRKRAVLSQLKLSSILLAMMIFLILVFGREFSSFFREHRSLREYANPVYPVYSLAKLAAAVLQSPAGPLQLLGLDAHVPGWDVERELIILVVGETVRADHLSLNGYARPTNPLLEKERVFSFTNVWSCGTSTSISVPCMFSHLPDSEFEVDKASHEENLLDVLAHADVNILWRDNNSNSKGVADRVPYQDWRSPDVNPVCDTECRDVGMLTGLQEYIDSKEKGDIVIVLHQMGNHGPAYFKRYPEAFEYFTPVCRSNELADCTSEEINNAYDNAIRYTDYFLAKVIKRLEVNSSRFETIMMYVSDHGESLGEYGLYLHGMPYVISPEQQRHVPVLFWFGDNYHDVDLLALPENLQERYTHSNIFHTVLGLLEMETGVYDPEKDMLPHGQEGLSEQPVAR